MKNILITGVSGFLGKNLTEYFHGNTQFKIFGYSRNIDHARAAIRDNSVQFLPEISNDILNNNDIDTIIHLAGIVHDLSGKYNENDYKSVNFEKTKKLYDHFLVSGSRTFIFLSSIKAVADHADLMIDEDYVPSPSSAYGKSKLQAEKHLQKHQIPDKYLYILRPCMIHGPGNKGNLNMLYKFVKKGIPYPLGSFDNKRSFLSVANFCFIVEKILHGELQQGTYHLADDPALSTNELVQLIGQGIGKKAPIWNVPRMLIFVISSVGSLVGAPINRNTIRKLTESMVVSNKKLLLNLGQQLPVSSKQGLLKTIKSLLIETGEQAR